MNKIKIIFAFGICLVLVGCNLSKQVQSKFNKSKSQSSIINGVKVQPTEAIAASVVGIYDSKEGFTCTGSLLANNVVLTAAHCISSAPSQIKIVFNTRLIATVDSKNALIQQKFMRTATDIKVHPEWNEKENEIKNIDWHDLALIKFAGDIPEGFKPATFLDDSSALVRGAVVTLAGYGVNNVDAVDINPKHYKNIGQAIANGEVVCDDSNKHCFKLDFQGNDELYQTQAPISVLTETEVRLNETLHGTCEGDSGGPAYLVKDGKYYLFGITSRGTFTCDSEGVYTNALVYKDWIQQTALQLK